MGIIDVVIWTQIGIIGLLFIFQTMPSRRLIAAFYGATLLAHALFFSLIPDSFISNREFWFYVSGGALDLTVIFFVAQINGVTRMAGDVQDISLVSIMFNILGIFLAFCEADPELYMGIYAALYAWAIFVLIRQEPENDGYFTVDTRFLAFDSNAYGRVLFSGEKKK